MSFFNNSQKKEIRVQKTFAMGKHDTKVVLEIRQEEIGI